MGHRNSPPTPIIPFVLVSPQCPRGQRWEPIFLSALLDEILEKYKIDEDRVYLTGLSMGGYGSWAWAAYEPQRFAAVAPICGGGEPFLIAPQVKDIPIWAFHGAQDPVVPLEQTESIVEAIKQQGGKVKLTVYPEAGHDSWTQTYAQPGILRMDASARAEIRAH